MAGNDMEGKKTVLIIDDEASLRRLFNKILVQEGYKVFESADGEGGLELIKENDIDLLLLDLSLPGIQGMDVLRRLRKEGNNIHVIIITGFGTPESEKEANELGAYSYIHKPCRLDDIKRLIKKAVDSARVKG